MSRVQRLVRELVTASEHPPCCSIARSTQSILLALGTGFSSTGGWAALRHIAQGGAEWAEDLGRESHGWPLASAADGLPRRKLDQSPLQVPSQQHLHSSCCGCEKQPQLDISGMSRFSRNPGTAEGFLSVQVSLTAETKQV